jgi:hypothetical protein
LPVDGLFLHYMQDTEVTVHLLPLPARSAPHPQKPTKIPVVLTPRGSAYVDGHAALRPGGKGGGGKGGKGAKDGGKSKKRKRSEHWVTATPDGQAYCFNFNSHTCTQQVVGGKCSRGLHQCMLCGLANHGLATCKNA